MTPEVIYQNQNVRVVSRWDHDEQRGYLSIEVSRGVDAMDVVQWIDYHQASGHTLQDIVIDLANALHQAIQNVNNLTKALIASRSEQE